MQIEVVYYDVFEAISKEILSRIDELEIKFNQEKELKLALCYLARSDRKKFGLNKFFPYQTLMKIYAQALEFDILTVEKSLEKPKSKSKYQKAKKQLKRNKIQDKLNFTSNFTRFWFYFIEPNLNALKNGKKDKILELIKYEFDGYASFGFEMLCREFLQVKFNITNVRSLWIKNIEIDLIAISYDKIIVGEVKFKEHKMCKNIINLLLKKCQRLSFKPDIITLFSKSGFSNELNELKSNKILLFDINDFKELL